MVGKVNPVESATTARLLELLSPNVRWQRSLWSVGTVFGISELLDACSSPQAHTLSESSQRNLLDWCKREVGNDRAIPVKEKSVLTLHMGKLPHPGGSAFPVLQQLSERLNTNYLRSWATLLRNPEEELSADCAGGWAAIESLLGEPNDRSAAADNLASLVACSIPRAELTHLSYAIEAAHPGLRESLSKCSINRDRAAFVARLVRSESALTLPSPSDQAAIQRMRRLLKDPGKNLTALQRSIAQAFHRLYRQRNHILHGGITSSIALAPTLRTAARIAGAGMDRVAHGLYADQLTPLELTARARIAINMVGPETPAEGIVDLLGS